MSGVAGVKLRTMRLMFGMAGIGISVWAITVPYTKIRFHIDDGTLGLMLLAGGTGGVLVMPFTGALLRRFGSRSLLLGAGLGFGCLVPLLSVAPSPLVFTILLLTYGALFGAADIALNAQGAVLERLSGRMQMSGFHACYSLGSLGVALACSLLLRAGVSNVGCAFASAAAILLIMTRIGVLLPKAEDAPAGEKRFAMPNRASLVLGLCCFVCFLTEGAATDWSTIYLKFSRGMPLASAALGYAGFAVAMAGSRLSGDAVGMRLGRPALMRLGCVLAVAGFGLVIFCPWGWAGIAGFGLVGLGTGNIAPLVLSAAARVKGMSADQSVPAVMALGYSGFLLGPVLIGQVADFLGLGAALGLDGLMVAGIFFAARAVE
jgi:predicted MFS family arabinose efflux permease